MIFATCGSSHFPFERMMQALGDLESTDLFVQHGPGTPPACAEAHAYLPFASIAQQMTTANVVVTHAGVGSILLAIRAGHTPIVFPRLKRYGECVDDHQAELAAALENRDEVLVARTGEELVEGVALVPPRSERARVTSRRLIDAVHASIVRTPLR